MRKWLLVVSLTLFGALAFAACGGNGDAANESDKDGNLPQVSDDARPSVGGQYRVTVSFNEDAAQADLDQVGALLAGYDGAADYLIQESFPPTGVANLTTDADDFCETVVSALESEAFVTSASCGPQLEPGDVDLDGQTPGELTDADCEPVELRSDCGIDPALCNQVHNIDACTGDDDVPGAQTSPACVEGVVCDDVVVLDTCGGVECEGLGDAEEDPPLAPPGARSAVDGQYTIIIRFNETVSADQLDEVGARILDFDPDAEYVIQESFPPTGVANFVADTEDVCLALVQGLEDETFVTSVSCGPRLEPGDTIDPDEPVANDLP